MKRAEICGYLILLAGAGLAVTCGFSLGIPEFSFYGKYFFPGAYQSLVVGMALGMLIMVGGLWLAARSEDKSS